MATTRDGIEVKVGQVWRDLDKRMSNRQRKVIAISEDGTKVQMKHPHLESSRAVWVSVSRMYRHATGWELVKDW